MDWMKYRLVYFAISAIVIGAGVFGFLKWGMNYGIDFTGGTIAEYKVEKQVNKDDLTQKIKKEGIEVSSIQTSGNGTYLFRLSPVSVEQKSKVEKIITD